MKKTLFLQIFIWIFISANVFADSSETEGIFELGFVVGKTELIIEDKFSLVNEEHSEESATIGIELGYKWPEGYSIESSIINTSNFNLFKISDTYSVFQWSVLAGYSFDLTNDFRFIPKIGLSYWVLDSEEGQFLNPGPEAKYHYTDIDFTYELAFEVPISQDVTINLSYMNTKYTFGDISIANFGMTFEF
jgi:hypothetical protein